MTICASPGEALRSDGHLRQSRRGAAVRWHAPVPARRCGRMTICASPGAACLDTCGSLPLLRQSLRAIRRGRRAPESLRPSSRDTASSHPWPGPLQAFVLW